MPAPLSMTPPQRAGAARRVVPHKWHTPKKMRKQTQACARSAKWENPDFLVTASSPLFDPTRAPEKTREFREKTGTFLPLAVLSTISGWESRGTASALEMENHDACIPSRPCCRRADRRHDFPPGLRRRRRIHRHHHLQQRNSRRCPARGLPTRHAKPVRHHQLPANHPGLCHRQAGAPG